MGAWLLVAPSTINGADLGFQKWRDSILLWYGIGPLDLPIHCSGYGVGFSIYHDLDFKKGGLVTSHHNKIYDRVTNLSRKARTSTHTRVEPLIHPGRALKSERSPLDGTHPPKKKPVAAAESKHKGDLLIQDMWKKRTECIINMGVVNTDYASYIHKTPEKSFFFQSEKLSIWMSVSNNVIDPPTFVVSVNGFMGTEVEDTMKHLVIFLTAKWRQP